MASTKLSRTAGTPTSNKKFTISYWVKQSGVDGSGSTGEGHIFDTYTDANNRTQIHFDSDDVIDFRLKVSGTNIGRLKTNRKFRDPSAWYHIVASVDTTQSTEADRIKLYINGTQETSFSIATYPSQNADFSMGGTHTIGAYGGGTNYYNGVLTHIHYVDGTGYAASTFGESDSTSGIWKPKTAPSVTYGTNGFFLKMENSGAMGTDSSGNTNTFTVSGNLTQNVDTPSNNFATLNPLAGNCTFSNGNNTWVGTSSGNEHSSGTLGVSSGKYYWEVKPNGACGAMGITDPTWQFNRRGSIIYASSSQSYVYEGNGYVSHDSYGDIANNYSNYGSSDIIGIALDLDNNKLYFSKNGTYENSGVPTSGSTGTGAISIQAPSTLFTGFYTPLVADLCGASTGGGDCNFGNGYFGTTAVSSAGTAPSQGGIFEYDCPSGYQALCTKGINSF